MNEAQRLIDEGNNVTLLYCDNGVNYCFANTAGDSKICFLCRKMQKQWVGLLKGKFRAVSYRDLSTPQIDKIVEKIEFKYDGVSEIKHLKYKNVKIGFGALSTYISKTRNLNPEISPSFKIFFDNLLRTQCEVVEFLESFTAKNKVDSIVVLNGRHFEVRPVFDFALANNIKVSCLEKGNSMEKDDFRGFDYTGFLPHNLINLNNLIHEIWQESMLPEEEKVALGISFFEKRRNNIAAGDTVYTLNQEKDLLPVGWNPDLRNFVILNSSEDEFAAIGDEFDKLSFFSDQIFGIKKIAELTKDEKDICIYLRVHPNLIPVKYSYHQDLYNIEKEYQNIKVIPATDKVSTYALIENAEKIIVFGSTTGIEAVYMEKPVILLAGSIYYYMDLCYIPSSQEELLSLLLSRLQPRKKNEAVKYGFYILSIKGFPFSKLTLTRANKLPFKPLKINNESYYGLLSRFIYSKLLSKLEIASNNSIPTTEKSA